ncbi:hypothetical protein Q8A67_022172 [Cirrhinus molitorella]|uniref:Uncharacterized protein n=1 Tax=Cirrhinus molitorella TaxID=172907 RepID=A0AA88P3I0_9TELE|nr:hypothetical protein Q8A67_022172 [Cirrhinus molitorella]
MTKERRMLPKRVHKSFGLCPEKPHGKRARSHTMRFLSRPDAGGDYVLDSSLFGAGKEGRDGKVCNAEQCLSVSVCLSLTLPLLYLTPSTSSMNFSLRPICPLTTSPTLFQLTHLLNGCSHTHPEPDAASGRSRGPDALPPTANRGQHVVHSNS